MKVAINSSHAASLIGLLGLLFLHVEGHLAQHHCEIKTQKFVHPMMLQYSFQALVEDELQGF